MKKQENIKHALSYILKEMDDRTSLLVNDDNSFVIIVKKDEKIDKDNLFSVGVSLFKQSNVVITIFKSFVDMIKEEGGDESKLDLFTLDMPFGKAFEFMETRAKCFDCKRKGECPKFEDDCELHRRIEEIIDEAKNDSENFISIVKD